MSLVFKAIAVLIRKPNNYRTLLRALLGDNAPIQ